MLSNLTTTLEESLKEIASKTPKMVLKKAQNRAKVEGKRQGGCTSKTIVKSLHRQVQKKYLNLTPAPEPALMGTKMQKKTAYVAK